MDTVATSPGMIMGAVRMRRTGWLSFPFEELAGPDGPVARLGRDSALGIFFGTGRRVLLTNGIEWRIKAASLGRHIVPVIRSKTGTVAFAGPLGARRSYGITGKDFGLNLVPLGKVGLRRTPRWGLLEHETRVATVDDRTRVLTAVEPIPLAAALMAFTLITHGIPGEADLVPSAS